MSKPGLFQMMARNYKKSLAYFGISSTAVYLFYDYTITQDVMKASCKKAAIYGDELLRNSGTPIRHITVILNPVACKRKSKKLYTKWVEPLLHLAGIKVSLIETESLKQAYELMKIMSKCDGVAIVGGDGTVHEALNGLLNRPDCSKATREIPIGIIPAGQNNSIARYIHQSNLRYRNQKEFLIESTMRLVDSVTRNFDVLKITPAQGYSEVPVEKSSQNTTVEPIYALRDLRYGVYQDNFYKVSGIRIYQTYVKPLWLRVQRSLRFNSNYPAPKIEAISYTEPCIGCSACFDRHRIQDRNVEKSEETRANRRWWNVMAPVKSNYPNEDEKRQLELSKRINPDCQNIIRVGDVETITDFRACMMGEKKVRLSLGRNREYNPSDITETQEVFLRLPKDVDETIIVQASNDVTEQLEQNTPEDDKQSVQYLIDGQHTKARSVDITAIQDAVTIFTGPYKILIPKAQN